MTISLTPQLVGEAVDVRDPAETRRRVKITITLLVLAAIVFYFWTSIDNTTVEYLLEDRTAESVPSTLQAHTVTFTCALILVWFGVFEAIGRLWWGLAGVAAIFVLGRLLAAVAGIDTLAMDWGPWIIVVVPLVLFAVAAWWRPRLTMPLSMIVCGVAFMLSFIIWAYSDQEAAFKAVITNPLPGTFAIATPLILGALAGCLCERSGVINIAIEGQFLLGAFFASVLASLVFNAYAGLLGGIIAGMLIAAMLALFSIRYLVNQVVLGVVLVLFATGLTAFLLDQIPSDPSIKEYLNDPPKLENIAIPGLSDLPVIGEAMFNQTALVYLMYLSVALVTFILFETRWGLRVRSVGEHPTAADTVGIKVKRMRWQAVLFAGVFAGLGGAYFTVGSTGSFDKDASSGNGFIALAAVIMGRWHPIYATFAALFFGFMSSLQDQLKLVAKIPSELLTMTPYIATVVAVAGFVGRVRPPAADGEPYVKS